MLGEQEVADIGDLPSVLLLCRPDGQVAFRIEAGRAIVEVGRSKPYEFVVDDQQLGVNLDHAIVVAVGHDRVDRAQPAIPVRALQPVKQPVPVAAHIEALG
jgi:hypothetical protein